MLYYKLYVLFTVCILIHGLPTPADDLLQAVLHNLEYAGEARGRVMTFLESNRPFADKYRAACFIIAHLGLNGLARFSPEVYQEHLDYAFKARRELPWSAHVPEAIFTHYVLPPAIAQEPVEAWRKTFFTALEPRVRQLKTLPEVAQAVNLWVYEQAGFVSTSSWDAPPLSLCRSSLGRCEELMILYIAAARSVGLPCRQAYTPAWPFMNNNHAWVEVYTGGGWHYLGAAEPSQLSHTWFSRHVTRTSFVFASAVGSLPRKALGNDEVFRRSDYYSLLNTISEYQDSTPFTVRLLLPDGRPYTGTVRFYSFGYGSLMEIARLRTNDKGIARFSLGRADVLLVAQTQAAFLLTPIRGSLQKSPTEATYTLAPLSAWQGWSGWLRCPEAPPENAPSQSHTVPEINQLRKQLHQATNQTISKQAAAILTALCPDLENTLNSVQQIRGNAEQIAATLAQLEDPGDRQDLLALVDLMTEKDLWQVTSAQLSAEVRAFQSVKDRWGIRDSNAIAVLRNPRILYEDWWPWRSILYTRHRSLLAGTVADTVRAVEEQVKSIPLVDKDDHTLFNGMCSPLVPEYTGYAYSEVEKQLYAVALLRCFGIPARLLPAYGYRRYEYYDGNNWRLGHGQAKEPAPMGDVRIACAQQADLQDKHKPRYMADFSLLAMEEGRLRYFLPSGEPSWQDDCFQLRAPVGRYVLCQGTRNVLGEAFVRLIPFRLGTGEPVTLALDDLSHLPGEKLQDFLAKKVRLPKDLRERVSSDAPLRLYILAGTGSESELATISELERLHPIPVCPMYLIAADRPAAQVLKQAFSIPVLLDKDGLWRDALPVADGMPIVLAVDGAGEVVFFQQGWNLEIDDLVQRFVDLYRKHGHGGGEEK